MVVKRDMFVIEKEVLSHLNRSIFVQCWLKVLDRLSKVGIDNFFGKESQIEHFLSPG
jgi:hypothetical protein